MIKKKSFFLPIENNKSLFLAINNKKVRISSINDLKDYVYIDQIHKALDFIRLRTSPKTNYLMSEFYNSVWVEIFPLNNLDVNFFYGDKKMLEQHKTHKYGRNGIMSADYIKKLKIKLDFEEDSSEFLISRFICKAKNDGVIYKTSEKVSKKGKYELISLKEYLKNTDVYVPTIE